VGVSKLSKMPVSRANLEKRELSSEEPSDSPAGGAKGAGELRRRAAENNNKSARGTHGPQNPQTTGTQLVARRPLSESELERVVEERGQEEHPCAGVFNIGNLRKNFNLEVKFWQANTRCGGGGAHLHCQGRQTDYLIN